MSPTPDGEETLQLGPEAGVEPAVHDRVGEGRGHGQGVAEAEQDVVGVAVLLKGRKKEREIWKLQEK